MENAKTTIHLSCYRVISFHMYVYFKCA